MNAWHNWLWAVAVVIAAVWGFGCMGYTIPIAGEGYSGPTNPQPGQTIAAHIVWNETYGDADGTEPPVMWHFGDSCVDSTGSWGAQYGTIAAFKAPHADDCILGQYQDTGWAEASEYDAPNRVDAEWNGNFSSEQTFAHELCHAYRQYLTGDADGGHTSDCFVGSDGKPYAGGVAAPGSLVYQANAALIAAGL